MCKVNVGLLFCCLGGGGGGQCRLILLLIYYAPFASVDFKNCLLCSVQLRLPLLVDVKIQIS